MSGQSRKIEKELKKISISLNKFFILYCEITEEIIFNTKMSHKDIKLLFPNLRRISFELAYKNKNLLAMGKIIIVEDSFGNIAPYIAPDILPMNQILSLKNKEEQNKIENVIINENLSKYELVLLCRYYKNHNKYEEYCIANRLLKKKKEACKVKVYKNKKDGLKEKERQEYEEF